MLLPLPQHSRALQDERGTFESYYTNRVGYLMARFNPCIQRNCKGEMVESPPPFIHGGSHRIFTGGISQMRTFYLLNRFTESEVREIQRKVHARARREAQRGFIGSFPEGRVMGTWPVEKLPAVIIGLIAQYV